MIRTLKVVKLSKWKTLRVNKHEWVNIRIEYYQLSIIEIYEILGTIYIKFHPIILFLSIWHKDEYWNIEYNLIVGLVFLMFFLRFLLFFFHFFGKFFIVIIFRSLMKSSGRGKTKCTKLYSLLYYGNLSQLFVLIWLAWLYWQPQNAKAALE